MPRQAATIGSLSQAFEVVKEMQADGPDRGEGCRPLGRQAPAGIIAGGDHRGPYGRGGGPLARHPRRQRHARPAQRHLPTLPARRARRHRTRRAAYPALLPDRGSEGLRKACLGDRPCDPGRLRSGALDPQGRRGPAGPARAPGPGGAGDPPRRQEGDHRLPFRWQREHRGTGALPRPAVPPRPDRRGPRDDLASMAARGCLQPCRSSGTASPSGGAGRTGSGTSSTGSAQPTGRASAPGPSLPCATIPTICSPASATGPLPGEGRSGPPTPPNDGSARCADEPGPWEPSGTGHRWTASSMRSSSTKTGRRESVPHSP